MNTSDPGALLYRCIIPPLTPDDGRCISNVPCTDDYISKYRWFSTINSILLFYCCTSSWLAILTSLRRADFVISSSDTKLHIGVVSFLLSLLGLISMSNYGGQHYCACWIIALDDLITALLLHLVYVVMTLVESNIVDSPSAKAPQEGRGSVAEIAKSPRVLSRHKSFESRSTMVRDSDDRGKGGTDQAAAVDGPGKKGRNYFSFLIALILMTVAVAPRVFWCRGPLNIYLQMQNVVYIIALLYGFYRVLVILAIISQLLRLAEAQAAGGGEDMNLRKTVTRMRSLRKKLIASSLFAFVFFGFQIRKLVVVSLSHEGDVGDSRDNMESMSVFIRLGKTALVWYGSTFASTKGSGAVYAVLKAMWVKGFASITRSHSSSNAVAPDNETNNMGAAAVQTNIGQKESRSDRDKKGKLIREKSKKVITQVSYLQYFRLLVNELGSLNTWQATLLPLAFLFFTLGIIWNDSFYTIVFGSNTILISIGIVNIIYAADWTRSQELQSCISSEKGKGVTWWNWLVLFIEVCSLTFVSLNKTIVWWGSVQTRDMVTFASMMVVPKQVSILPAAFNISLISRHLLILCILHCRYLSTCSPPCFPLPCQPYWQQSLSQ
jgi:hypothetical protein